tara:strand:- start:469 stop:786 length:318 start_codon:yes stop_codon:yes gene_type:complete
MSDTLTHALSAVIDECNHDLFEQETACADGFCPICATIKLLDVKRELAEAKEQLRLCNIDQFTTAAELAEAKKDAERYRYVRSIWGLPDEKFNAAIDAAMKEGGK